MNLPKASGSWSELQSMSTARSHPAVAVFEGKIYAFGGGGPNFLSLNTSEVYDPASNRWSALASMPTTRSGAMAAVLGDVIYVMGGGFKKPDGKFKFLKTVEAYYPKEDRWEEKPSLLQPHDYPACSVLDGQIYIIGGHHPDATEGGPQTDPAFAFSQRWDTKADQWEEISLMPTARFASSAVTIDNRLWVMGGIAFTPEGFNEYNLIEVFDPQTGSWQESGLSLPYSSAGQGTCVLGDRLYSFGGFREGVGIGKHAVVCNLSQKSWSELPEMPHDRAAMGVAIIGETIYLVGGWRADRSVKNSVIAYQTIVT